MKKKHGGKRVGAGRCCIEPHLLKIPAGQRLPRWLVEWLRDHDETGAILIEKALIKTYKLSPPSNK